MVRFLANVMFKKIWARLILFKQRMMKQEEHSRAQKEEHQDRKMKEMAMSATEQIQRQIDKSLDLNWKFYLPKRSEHMLSKPNQTKKASITN